MSIDQALGIWSDLWQARFGRNLFGGDTAEIYAYRLMPMSPTYLTLGRDDDNLEAKACQDLLELLRKFEEDADCSILVNGYYLDEVKYERFTHRWTIKVVRRRER